MNRGILLHSISLALYAGLSLNLLLQMGINLRDFTRETRRAWSSVLIQGGVLSFWTVALWLLFTYALSPLSLGYLEYFLTFPLTAALFKGLSFTSRFLFRNPLPEGEIPQGEPSPEDTPLDGLRGGTALERSMATIAASLFFTRNLAGNFLDALILAVAFALGTLFAESLIQHIHQRISLERLPPVLRGLPLLLVSMGFLALLSEAVFSALLG